MAGELRPYWQSADGSLTVYHAPCEAVIASVLPVREVALVHGDPQYGVNERTARASNGRGRGSSKGSNALATARDFPPIPGDDKPFDPAHLLALARPLVLWGANHYSDKVPGSPSWITWDKREGVLVNDNADCELAWSNLGGPARIFRHLWAGMLRASEQGEPSIHSTQKPKALAAYCFQRAKLKKGDLVFVPYAGSLPEGPVCQAMGLRLIACDVERWCLDAAISRLGAITADRAAEPCGPLFGAVEPVRK